MAIIQRHATQRQEPPILRLDATGIEDTGNRSPFHVRGACPALSAPMVTGDGLLVRLRPLPPGLTLQQFRKLCEAAARHGNGIIEITARGSLQLRGLKPETLEGLRKDLDRAGIQPETGVTIETSALSGLDPFEAGDAQAMAARLRRAIAALAPDLTLAPKLSIVVDGGGRPDLGDIAADIRLTATGETVDRLATWHISVGGTAHSARLVNTLPDDKALNAVTDMLKMLTQLGPRARGRDLYPAIPETNTVAARSRPGESSGVSRSSLGIHRLGSRNVALGLKLRSGQADTAALLAFLDRVADQGVTDIRTGPQHMLFLLGLTETASAKVQLAAANFGFITSADDPANHIASCAGAGACTSAFYRTKVAAADLVYVPSLLDGSMTVHLSGCAKGCALSNPSPLTIVGTPDGCGLVVNGPASAPPIAYIQEHRFGSAMQSLDRLLREHKETGESANACLTRLGADAIATAIKQG